MKIGKRWIWCVSKGYEVDEGAASSTAEEITFYFPFHINLSIRWIDVCDGRTPYYSITCWKTNRRYPKCAQLFNFEWQPKKYREEQS